MKRLQNIARSDDVIVDILVNGIANEDEMHAGDPKGAGRDSGWKEALNRVSKMEKLEEVATSARDVYIRSLAARRLSEEFGRDDVRIMHNVCHYCGGKVECSDPYAGTIESHFVWKCQRCGHRQDQTILGPSAHDLITGDYYVLGEPVAD